MKNVNKQTWRAHVLKVGTRFRMCRTFFDGSVQLFSVKGIFLLMRDAPKRFSFNPLGPEDNYYFIKKARGNLMT